MIMISKIDCRGMSILVGPQNLMDRQFSIGDGLGEHDGAEVRLIHGTLTRPIRAVLTRIS
jgi:hypothetical protein